MARREFSASRLPGFGTVTALAFAALYAPILVLVVFSFNGGTSVAEWTGFTLKWYPTAWSNTLVRDATLRSVEIATIAAVLSSVAATMAAIGTTRRRAFRGQTAIYMLINQPLMVPEIVTGVALLIFFSSIKVATGYGGLAYLIAAHTAFCIPFAYLPIRARLEGMDRTLETAAADLYATPWQAFRRVTLPLLMPAILAGMMLAFVISLDDVVITLFVKSAGQDTLPTLMIGQIQRGIRSEVYAIASMLLAVTMLLLTLLFLLTNRTK